MKRASVDEKSDVFYSTFQFLVQSDLSESRKSAAMRIIDMATFLDVDEEQQVDAFFAHLEHLLADDSCSDERFIAVKQTLFTHLPELFRFLRLRRQIPSRNACPSLFEQANLRLPVHLVRYLSYPPSLSSESLFTLQQCSVQTLSELFDEPDLLSQEVIQYLVVPSIFCFFRRSDEEEIPPQNNDNSESERWFRLRIQALSIITNIFCRSHRFSRDWLDRYLIPQCMEFHSGIIKNRELRVVLAHSLVNIAEIAGTEFTDRQLFPIFQRYMRDTPEVQFALLQHLSAFCKILSAEYRESMIRELSHQVTIDPGDSRTWRQRVQFAGQLTRLVQFFPVTHINNHLSGFALAFSADRISEVRICGVEMLAVVLAAFVHHEWNRTMINGSADNSNAKKRCSDCFDKTLNSKLAEHLDGAECGPIGKSTSTDMTTPMVSENAGADDSPQLPLTDRLLADIRLGFWRTRNWRRRQSFGRLLFSLSHNKLIDDEQFYYLFHHDLMRISDDDVANVRQYFCLLARHNHFYDQSNGQNIRKRLERMANSDADLENRNLAKIALGKLNPDEEGIDLKDRSLRIVGC